MFTYRTPFLLGDWKFSATFITAYKVKDLLPLGTLEDRSIKLHRGKPSQVGPKREIDKRRGFSKGNMVQKHRCGGRVTIIKVSYAARDFIENHHQHIGRFNHETIIWTMDYTNFSYYSFMILLNKYRWYMYLCERLKMSFTSQHCLLSKIFIICHLPHNIVYFLQFSL